MPHTNFPHPEERSAGARLEGRTGGNAVSKRRLLAVPGVVDDVGKIVVRGVERLHFCRAIGALLARRDAFFIGPQRLHNLGHGAYVARADGAAIDPLRAGGRQYGQGEQAGMNALHEIDHSHRKRRVGTMRLTLGPRADISPVFPYLTR